ncbi:MAG: prefoldin subunit alpha [Candidatus Aenigmatarchaeota archaeon]
MIFMTTKNEQLNEKYILYQILAQNLEALKQQLELVEEQIIEIKISLASINDLKEIKEENEILIPLGSGCFGKGKITEKSHFLVNIGSGIFVYKDLENAKTFLEERFKEIENAGKEIEGQAKKIAVHMNELSEEIQNLASEIASKNKVRR